MDINENDDDRFENRYRCDCGEEWNDTWSCMCNDRCPNCDREIEPYASWDNDSEELIEH